MGSRVQRAVVSLLLGLAVSGCPRPEPPPPPPAPPPVPEPVDPKRACVEAEKTLVRLDCRKPDGTVWAKTPQGSPFGDACYRAYQDGRDWHAECIAAIDDCDELERAYRGELCP